MAKVLMDQYFNVYGLPDQLHSDNGKEFVNNLWRELFSEFKIQHTTTSQGSKWDLFSLKVSLSLHIYVVNIIDRYRIFKLMF